MQLLPLRLPSKLKESGCTDLTDVDSTTPAFGLIPKSRRSATLEHARQMLGDDYCELPIRGPAGLCCIIDFAAIHTRMDAPDGDAGRRIMHHIFARAGTFVNDDGTERPPADPLVLNKALYCRGLTPERLAMSDDPATRRLFSLWPEHQQQWAATGFADDFISDPKAQRGPSPPEYKNPGPIFGGAPSKPLMKGMSAKPAASEK